jgi:hypothetical protein
VSHINICQVSHTGEETNAAKLTRGSQTLQERSVILV